MNSRRLPAEWEGHNAILLTWPHRGTDWRGMLPEVRDCYNHIIEAILPHEQVLLVVQEPRAKSQEPRAESGISTAVIKTNDTWTRDYGPITVEEDGRFIPLDFKFNGWGLKFAANYDNLVTRQLPLLRPVESHQGFVLEGGSIESDGNGTIMTTESCLLSPNRNGGMSQAEITEYLKKSLGAKQVLWLKKGYVQGDDTDGHIDTLARFAPDNTIVYSPNPEGISSELLEFTNIEGKKYSLIQLPIPEVIEYQGEELPATYANFLIIPGAVLMPTYGQPKKDGEAAYKLSLAFPEREILPIDCRALIKQHGSLHCATMQLYL